MSPPEPTQDEKGEELSEEELRSAFRKRIESKARELAKELPGIEGKRSLLLACVALWTEHVILPFVDNMAQKQEEKNKGILLTRTKEYHQANGIKKVVKTHIHKNGSRSTETVYSHPGFDKVTDIPAIASVVWRIGHNVVYKSLKNIAARRKYILPDQLITQALDEEKRRLRKHKESLLWETMNNERS